MIQKQKTAVAIGLFDGVHLGHQQVISTCFKFKGTDVNPCVLTFEHLNKNSSKVIFPEEIKTKKIKALGINDIIKLDFLEIKNLSAVEFVRDILSKKLNAQFVVCGYDFKFSKGKNADAKDLEKIASEFGIKVEIVPPFEIDDARVSSTNIRELLQNGKIEQANILLGEPYYFDFDVIFGNQIGRTIGFPTINQQFPEEMLVPKYGVYGSITEFEGKTYKSITNIGVKPTIHSNIAPLAETHIIGLSENLYGKKIKVSLIKYLREEKKFSSIDELKFVINNDIKGITDEQD